MNRAGGIGQIKACILNGVCESWENARMCPSDCGTTTTTKPSGGTTSTTAPSSGYCGNDICEAGEDFSNCAEDCLKLPPTTTVNVTQPSGIAFPTGMFAAITGNLFILLLILLVIAALLAIFAVITGNMFLLMVILVVIAAIAGILAISAAISGNMFLLALMLLMVAAILAIYRYLILPRAHS